MIRYATKEDAPRIQQLIKDLAEYEKAPSEAKATIEQIEETITQPGLANLVSTLKIYM